MKVEIKESNQVKERPFPKLMETEFGTIALMYGMIDHYYVCGVVLKSENYGTGLYQEDWVLQDFSDFEGSITLSND